MRWLAAVALVLQGACGNKDPGGSGSSANAPGDHMSGTLVVGGKPVDMTACRPGKTTSVFVEVDTPRGTLHFQDRTLSWITSESRGDMDCDRLATNKAIWGGGARTDGTAYFRGELKFTCTSQVGVVSGDLDLECGHITYEERARLDTNRREFQDKQRGSNPP